MDSIVCEILTEGGALLEEATEYFKDLTVYY
jgi:hypothetical protein